MDHSVPPTQVDGPSTGQIHRLTRSDWGELETHQKAQAAPGRPQEAQKTADHALAGLEATP